MPNKNIGVLYFLGSGQFYNRIDRDKFNTSFVSREEVRKITQFKTDKRKSGKTKPQIHHGKFKNCEFNKEKFMSEIKSYPPNKPIKIKVSKTNMTYGATELCKSPE